MIRQGKPYIEKRWHELLALCRSGAVPGHCLFWLWTALLCGLVFGLVIQSDVRDDWHLTFFPAGKNWLDPYENSAHLVYPPWLALILAPYALFPEDVGRGLFAATSVALTAYSIRKLGGGFVTLLLVLLTPFYMAVLVRGQVDALPLMGLALAMQGSVPGQAIGLMLLMLKPQTMGLATVFLILLLAKNAQRGADPRAGLRARRMQVAVGVGLMLALSFAVYGRWPLDIWQRLPALYRVDDISPWPWGIAAGLPMGYYAYRKRNLPLAALATYFFVPYFNWYSLSGYAAIVFSWVPRWFAAVLLLVLSWVWFLIYKI